MPSSNPVLKSLQIIGDTPTPVSPPRTMSLGMRDTYGDGWNAATINVLVNDVAVITGQTLSSGSGPTYIDFTYSGNESIKFTFPSVGSYPSELRVSFHSGPAGSGTLLYDATSFAANTTYSFTPSFLDLSSVGESENICALGLGDRASLLPFAPNTSWGNTLGRVMHSVKASLGGSTALLNLSNQRSASVQVFTSNGTVNTTGGGSILWVMMFGGGAGGASGARQPAGILAEGGTGGQGGGFEQYIIPLNADLTYSVIVGAAGIGASSRTTDGSSVLGTNGGNSSVASISLFQAVGGTTGTIGESTSIILPTTNNSTSNRSNRSPRITTETLDLLEKASSTFFKTLGGCAGGSILADESITPPAVLNIVSETFPSMSGSSSPGAAAPSPPSNFHMGGWGGNGGSASTNSNALKGGAGGNYGGGGAGGGASRSGFNSGAGGHGANGIVIVVVI